jgi:Bax protein
MKKIIIVLFLQMGLISTVWAKNTAQAYIKQHHELAQKIMKQSSIPASITLAIALVESGNGTSRVCRKLNNHFGVRGKNSGKIKSGYKEFASTEAAYADFTRMISKKKYYPKLKGQLDIKKWVTAMKKSGYSEVPDVWAKKIFSTISQFNLTAYDKE